jgi:hypothetical protein
MGYPALIDFCLKAMLSSARWRNKTNLLCAKKFDVFDLAHVATACVLSSSIMASQHLS